MAENFEGLKDLNKKYSQKRTSISILLTVLFVVLSVYIYACLLFYSVFYQVEVIGRSMQPTFNANLPADENEETTIYKDIAVVNRYETGTNGDVIIIHLTGSESDDGEEKDIIKRVIATEGQTLTLKRDESDNYYHYYLNGVKLDESYIGEHYKDMGTTYYNRFKNKFEDDEDYKTEVSVVNGYEQTTIVIPEGYKFALGDNRGDSNDSTYYGAFSESSIKGKVAFSYSYDEDIGQYFWEQFLSIF